MVPLHINKLRIRTQGEDREWYEFSDPSTPLLDDKDFLTVRYERSECDLDEEDLAPLITKEDLHRGIRFDVAPELPHYQERYLRGIYYLSTRRHLNPDEIEAVLKVLSGK